MILKNFFIHILFFTLLSVSLGLQAQIKCEIDHSSFVAEYRVKQGNDTIFGFKSTKSKLDTIGSLTAYVNDSVKGWRFTWWQYNVEKKAFSDSLTSILADSTSRIDNLGPGGYRVIIQKDTLKTSKDSLIKMTFHAWVYINNDSFYFKVFKGADGYIKGLQNTCEALELYAIATDTFYYYDPVSKKEFLLKYKMRTVKWTSDPSYTLPNDGKTLIVNDTKPPFVDTKYFISVEDLFGTKRYDTALYKPVRTEAKLKLKTLKYAFVDDKWVEKSDSSGEAVLTARFKNESKNGAKFYWTLADTLFKENKDSIKYTRTDTTGVLEYRYHIPYTYTVKLTSESSSGCTDTYSAKIIVNNSKIPKAPDDNEKLNKGFPNVFTPNGRGGNDYFFYNFENFESIRRVHLSIYDRRGWKVYDYEGDVTSGWKGWDGKTRLGSEAPVGIYFWVLEVEGWGNIDLVKSGGSNGTDSQNTSGSQKSGTETPTGTTPTSNNIESTDSKRYTTNGYVYLYR